MTATWNETGSAERGWDHAPPAAPPLTDSDPCATWAPHDHPTGSSPPQPSVDWTFGAPTPPPPSPPATPPPTGRGGGARGTLAGMALGGLLAAGLVGIGWYGNDLLDQPTTNAGSVTAATTAAPAPVVPGEEPAADVAAALQPSVVQISVQAGSESGVGSGVVYDGSGLIITNAHVVSSARTVSVRLYDGTVLDGRVLGADEATDVAVVQVDASAAGDSLTPARLAAGSARVGQLAVAVGSPFGLEQTVTAGIVSAVDRPVDNPQGVVVGMIQTDAPINPGNSGGALANRAGEVIGINTLIFSQSGENNGIGFAIPIDKAREVADKLSSGQSVERAWLGVAGAQQASGGPGAEVTSVESGSPADVAGLEAGDRVTAIDGTTVKAFDELAAKVGERSPGDRLVLTVERDGATVELTVTLDARPAGR